MPVLITRLCTCHISCIIVKTDCNSVPSKMQVKVVYASIGPIISSLHIVMTSNYIFAHAWLQVSI